MKIYVDTILRCPIVANVNADEKVNVTVQIDLDLLAKVDERADELDLNRSQYLRRVIKRDLGLPLPAFDKSAIGNPQSAIPGEAVAA